MKQSDREQLCKTEIFARLVRIHANIRAGEERSDLPGDASRARDAPVYVHANARMGFYV